MPLPKFNEFMKPVLDHLNDQQDHQRSEIYKVIADDFDLSESDKQEYNPSGNMPVYKSRISWALTYLKKAGLIDSPKKALFRITERGKEVLEENPDTIDSRYLKKFKDFRDFSQPKTKKEMKIVGDDLTDEKTPLEILEGAYRTISDALSDELLTEVMNKTPDFFEKLVVDLLVRMGYGGSLIENGQVIGKSGDEGIDGVIKEDKLGFNEIYIQAKQWDINKTVGRPEIQKFVGALTGKGANKGAFITTANFSYEAKAYADKQHACKLVLIDGKKLSTLMIEYNLGVSVENTYSIKRIDSDYFNEDLF